MKLISDPNQPLRVQVIRGRLVISVGVETLAWCHNATAEDGFTIVDSGEFAKELVMRLRHEQDDGTTPVHLLLDAAISAAIDNGALGVEGECKAWKERNK